MAMGAPTPNPTPVPARAAMACAARLPRALRRRCSLRAVSAMARSVSTQRWCHNCVVSGVFSGVGVPYLRARGEAAWV